MKVLNIQDWCAIIGAIIAIGGVIWGIIRYFHKKCSVKAANLRANFFKSNKSWCLRIYNASDEEIEAFDITVVFPQFDGVITSWKCNEDSYPSLKRHGCFDIRVLLCTAAPDIMPVDIHWRQGKKEFTTSKTAQLR